MIERGFHMMREMAGQWFSLPQNASTMAGLVE
jgi:hypothetical protein